MMRRFYRSESSPIIAVFGADSWLGHTVAWAILHHCRKPKFTLRLIVRNESAVDDLVKAGAEVSLFDYEHDQTIDTALTGVTTVIFNPEVEKGRVDEAGKFADSAKRVNLPNVIILSILGAGDSKSKTFNDYRDIEHEVEGSDSRWVTLRPSLISERFIHYKQRIRENHAITLNVNRDSRWAPLNFKDLFEAISVISFDDNNRVRDEIERKHVGQRYTLTGSETTTGPLIADTINYVIGQKDSIEFLEVPRAQHKEYLESLSDQRDDKSLKALDKPERDFEYPLPPPPNSAEIELILDFYDYVKTGKADYISGDYRLITNEDPQRLIYFFENNSKSFRPNHRRRPLPRSRFYNRL